MRFDNIFVPKEKTFGWTLNFDNPLAWVVLVLLMGFLVMALLPSIKMAWYYLRSSRK